MWLPQKTRSNAQVCSLRSTWFLFWAENRFELWTIAMNDQVASIPLRLKNILNPNLWVINVLDYWTNYCLVLSREYVRDQHVSVQDIRFLKQIEDKNRDSRLTTMAIVTGQ